MEYGKVRKRNRERERERERNTGKEVPTGPGASLTELKGA